MQEINKWYIIFLRKLFKNMKQGDTGLNMIQNDWGPFADIDRHHLGVDIHIFALVMRI